MFQHSVVQKLSSTASLLQDFVQCRKGRWKVLAVSWKYRITIGRHSSDYQLQIFQIPMLFQEARNMQMLYVLMSLLLFFYLSWYDFLIYHKELVLILWSSLLQLKQLEQRFQCRMVTHVQRSWRHHNEKLKSFNVRSSRPEEFCKNGFLRNSTKLTGKHLCRSLYFNSCRRLWHTLAQVFSCQFCEIFKNKFFYRTPLVAASVIFISN